MANPQDHSFDDLRNSVAEYSRIVRRRWRLALLSLSVISSMAFWGSQYFPRTYQATTIFERRDDAVLRNLVHSNSPYSFDHLKNSLVLDITGSRALAEASADLGLLEASILDSDKALTNEQRKALDEALGERKVQVSVKLLHSSPSHDTIQLSCEADTPEAARKFVVALRDRYIRNSRTRISDILRSTRDFFRAELEQYQKSVANASSTLKSYFDEFPGVDPSDVTSVGTRLEDLRRDKHELLQREAELLAQIQAREQFLQEQLPALAHTQAMKAKGTSVPVARRPQTDEQTQTLTREIERVEFQLAEAQTAKRMTAEHPKVVALQRQLAQLRAALPGETVDANVPLAVATEAPSERLDPTVDPARMRVELELDALRKQLIVVSGNLDKAEAREEKFAQLYERMMASGGEIRELEDQLEQDEATATIWRQHLAQLDRIVAAEAEDRGTRFALVEQPRENARATSPRVASIYAVCTGLGLAVAAILIALAELFDRSFRSASQVSRALGLPVLECIETIATPTEKRRRLQKRVVWTPTIVGGLLILLITAGLAYSSLERPQIHQKAVERLDTTLQTVGIPPTGLRTIEGEP